MIRFRPTARRLAIASACTGLLLAGTSGTWAWVRASNAAADGSAATRSAVTVGKDVVANVTTLLGQDADLLLALSREPSFARWERLPGTDSQKLSGSGGPADRQRTLMQATFVDYSQLFPSAFQSLAFIDTTGARPIAVLNGGNWVQAGNLPTTAPESTQAWFGTLRSLAPGDVRVTPPYTGTDGEPVVSLAARPLHGGLGGVLVATLQVSWLGDSLTADGVSLSNVIALVDRRDGSILATGAGANGVTKSTASTAVHRLASAGQAVELTVGADVVSVLPAEGEAASGLDLGWLGIVSEVPLPPSGLRSLLQPVPLSVALFALLLLAVALLLTLRVRRQAIARAAEVRLERDRFAQGMTELGTALAAASSGHLATRLDVELGDAAMTALAASFDRTLGSLRDLVSQAKTNSSQLHAAATQLRASAGQQSASAGQQSAVVNETTATIAELAATAVQIAEASEAVSTIAQETLATTVQGRNAVEESVAAVEAVNEQARYVAVACEGFGEKITEIGAILAIIDELSDRTNLLSLNAAIEAARAGVHGRGFAVVASEIRLLAERSQESTVLIQQIITEVSSQARRAVDASAQGSRSAQAVTEQARAAAGSLDRIAQLVGTTTSAAQEISAATQQQRSASEQVVTAMADVSSNASHLAAGAKESASSAQELADLAVRTEESICHFITEQDLGTEQEQPGQAGL